MAKIIAFYLPQYHPTKHNNEWWGEGFTEWTNVAKAKPLFHGHYQPKIPADLGFYDLRMPEIRQKQVEMAKEAGVYGFCYYHYWFGDGHQELELPFNEVINSGKPDFPFCLCWANDSWSKKFWNKDGTVDDINSKILAQQRYLGKEDNILHFNTLLPAFKDSRYIRINNKLAFVIYYPFKFEGISEFIHDWNELAKANGLNGFHFIAQTINVKADREQLLNLGFDAICSCRLNRNSIRGAGWLFRKLYSVIFHTPRRCAYKKVIPTLVGSEERDYEYVYPTLIPNWDHTPRSGVKGDLYTNSTPELFGKHVNMVLKAIKHKSDENKICFLKSWNEWGEGNYMEPDLKFGKKYIYALRDALKQQK